MTRAIQAATILALTATVGVLAQRPTDVVKWSVADGVRDVKLGATVKVEVTADVAPGWHLYALTQPKGGPNPLKIAVAKGQPFEIKASAITAPAPDVTKDANFDLETQQYDGKVVFTVPVSAAKTAPAGHQKVPIEITFQACGNGICLRPFTQTLPVNFSVQR
jgi:DsbC/DsbD-like thiol-disulfide interchange protein